MKTSQLIIASLLCTIVYSCKNEKKEENRIIEEAISKEETILKQENENEDEEDAITLQITLEPKSESDVKGTVLFSETEGMVSMTAELSGLTEGTHAIHIHEKSDCSSPDGKSSGGHWNPELSAHGKWGAKEGYHKGDIGNFTADASGKGSITFATNEWCLGCDDEQKNIVEKAIIVHQGTDDYTSQPSGAAGSRVSCGAIIK